MTATDWIDVVKVIGQWWQLHTWHRCHGVPFTLDELRVVVEEAHAAGLPVTAHSHGLPAVEQAVAVGVDGIEHCSFLSASGIEQPDELLESLAASQITVCLTLGWAPGAAPSPAVPGWCPTVAGSDAGIGPVKPHGFQAEGIVAMVDAAYPSPSPRGGNLQGGAGLRLGKPYWPSAGRARRRSAAVEGEPLEDIGALRRVSGAMIQGTTIDIRAATTP